MGYNPNPPREELTASAGQTLFTFNFKIYENTNIKVYLTPDGSDPDDTADILTLTTDYTVTINGDDGGSISLVVPASLNDSITIVRDLPVTRTEEYQQSGDFRATVINDDQDYQTYLISDRENSTDRAFRIPDTIQGFSTSITSVVADGYFKVNSAGDGVEADPTVPQAVTDSSDNVLESGSWANEDEDVPVKEYTAGVPSDRSPTVYSAKHWATKAQDAVIGDVEFRDTEWRVFDDTDNTKKVAFQASGISSSTTRTITMPDNDVELKYVTGITGAKNLIINGDKSIQQRGTTGGTRQVIDASNVKVSGIHTASYTGTATVRIYEATTLGATDATTTWTELTGGASTSGVTVTLASGRYVKIEFSTTDFNFAQLERGSVATNYEVNKDELPDCWHYYQTFTEWTPKTGSSVTSSTNFNMSIYPMRITPNMTATLSTGAVSYSALSYNIIESIGDSADAQGRCYLLDIKLDAEHFTDTYYEDRWY